MRNGGFCRASTGNLACGICQGHHRGTRRRSTLHRGGEELGISPLRIRREVDIVASRGRVAGVSEALLDVLNWPSFGCQNAGVGVAEPVRRQCRGKAGQPLYGDGLMYHICIGQDGRKLLCRDLEAVLWHCGAWPQNGTALAVHLNIGGDQRATPEALQALQEVCDDWIAAGHGGRNEVWGHQELSPTSCPGTLMQDFVLFYREGVQTMASGQWFPETGHYVGGGFWDYWNAHGGLSQFGYPLTDEIAEVCEDGKPHTVQYFERAIFEWHPENQPPYDILLRRLGAAALAAKGKSG